MTSKLSFEDFHRALAGLPTSRKLTEEDLELVAKFKEDFSFGPPCECETCLRQYRTREQQDLIPYAYFGHEEDAASLAKRYVHSIESDRAFLRQTIAEFGVLILSRWRVKSARRRGFLKSARPDLYQNRNPLVDIPSTVMELRHQREHRIGYMLPYLNVDDLSRDPANFVGLLLHRTKCLPEEWVPFDHATLWSGWKQCTLTEKSADGCISMYGDRFGQWSRFDPNAVHRNDACGAPRGLLILESQQTLMKFLRVVTTVVLNGVKFSKSSNSPATISSTDPDTRSTDAQYLKVCTEWLQFLDVDRKKDQPWLSFGAMFSDIPYSAAPSFDIEMLIDIAENQANEAQDELWLLQTDLEYFHDRSKFQEATWFDKLMTGSHEKWKFDNIGFILTIKAVIHARDWQFLLDECRNVKRERERSKTEIGSGSSLPHGYERALGSLGTMLERCRSYHQMNLQRLLIRSPAFSNVFKVTDTHHHLLGPALIADLRDYSTLQRDDRIGWCLFQLTQNFDKHYVFEPSAVLRCLDDFLHDCTCKEAERIDPDMHRSISELTAITRMTKLLDLHRPSFRSLGPDIFKEARIPWRVLNNFVFTLSSELGLGRWTKPLSQFQMPTGRKDEKWLARRDTAHSALRRLWVKAQAAYEMMLKKSAVPQDFINSQMEWMKQCESAEHVARLDNERKLVMDRLRGVRERSLAREAALLEGESSPFTGQQEAMAKLQVPTPSKAKTKTRPVNTSAPESPPDKNEITIEEVPPILYKVKPASMEEKAVQLMFPDPNKDTTKEKSSIDWMDFVATLTTFGFRAEHRGGSAFTFRGEIKLPDIILGPQTRSFTVHRPHPSTEMGPVLLQSLGRRCNRRFGWKRANFDIEGSGVE